VGGQTVPGAVLGVTFFAEPGTSLTQPVTSVQFLFASEGSACLGAPAHIVASPNATFMRILLNVTGTSLSPGTYPVGGNNKVGPDGGFDNISYVTGSFGVENASGTTTAGALLPATKGSITIGSVSSTQVSGSYDLTFVANDSDHVTGSFTAPMCPPPSDAGAD
jgi:hypothetical protein